eukprot:3008945-Rhodomonas_salina.1
MQAELAKTIPDFPNVQVDRKQTSDRVNRFPSRCCIVTVPPLQTVLPSNQVIIEGCGELDSG